MNLIINNSRRIYFLDEVRGFCIILMVFYHLMWDLSECKIFSSFNLDFFYTRSMSLLRDFFAGLFVAMSGFSCNLSSSNLKRGLKCFGLALIVSLITYIVSSENFIVWGILHLLGFSMISFALFKRLFERINKIFLIIISLILFFLSFNIPYGYIGLGNFFIAVPDFLYQSRFFFAFGFPGVGFSSADYFPVLPWFFLFMFGAALGAIDRIYSFEFLYSRRLKFLGFCGRNTIYIYLFHQPVILLFFWICGKM